MPATTHHDPAVPRRPRRARHGAPGGPARRSTAILSVILVAALAGAAAAEPRKAAVGSLGFDYDPARWTLARTVPGGVELVPVDPDGDRRGPVRILRAPGRGCADVAREALPSGLYVEPAVRPARVAGRPAARYEAHTRCRNATPLGVVLCVPAGDAAYALVASVPGCRTGPGFGRGDPFAEFLDTLSLGR